MWKWKSDWGWCLGGAYFLAKFQAGGAYRGGAYKKKSVYDLTNGQNHEILRLDKTKMSSIVYKHIFEFLNEHKGW